jgi:CRISPR/Cas system endoribonuclease Cas6 (RAMP superfamily)
MNKVAINSSSPARLIDNVGREKTKSIREKASSTPELLAMGCFRKLPMNTNKQVRTISAIIANKIHFQSSLRNLLNNRFVAGHPKIIVKEIKAAMAKNVKLNKLITLSPLAVMIPQSATPKTPAIIINFHIFIFVLLKVDNIVFSYLYSP